MTTDITELAQSLKAAAEKATKGPWKAFSDISTGTFSIHTPRDKRCENIVKWSGFDCQKNAAANAAFIALANPENIRHLVKYTTELAASHAELRSTMAAIYNSIKEHGGLHAVAVMNAAKRAHEDSAAIAGETN
ncbi:TPA: ead/Ea22-like family protein [Klebsiella aerogenes]|nr:ead/Ea22-like family protein [Klebsiella aerogenes]HBS5699523.1 ead/Ea22-like family protein [Klebsiella aerogenes]